MEWVETTAKTVAEAQDLALDKLGVDELEAEFEILEEPKQGLFGRVRGQARVRARIAPKAPRPKEDRNRRRRSSSGSGNKKRSGGGADGRKDGNRKPKQESAPSGETADATEKADAPASKKPAAKKGGGSRSRSRKPETKSEESSMEEVSQCVEEFLTGLTAAFGLDAPVTIDTTDGEINARIEGKHGLLLGPKARTLDAIQELTRVTAQRTAPSSIRIKVDVGGYREQRRASLESFAAKAAERAVEEKTEVVLEPMSSADRKVIHDSLSSFDGVSTRSAGNDPRRYVIVVPEGDAEAAEEADSEGADD